MPWLCHIWIMMAWSDTFFFGKSTIISLLFSQLIIKSLSSAHISRKSIFWLLWFSLTLNYLRHLGIYFVLRGDLCFHMLGKERTRILISPSMVYSSRWLLISGCWKLMLLSLVHPYLLPFQAFMVSGLNLRITWSAIIPKIQTSSYCLASTSPLIGLGFHSRFPI